MSRRVNVVYRIRLDIRPAIERERPAVVARPNIFTDEAPLIGCVVAGAQVD